MNASAFDRLGWIVLDASLAAWVWSGLAALAMVLCRQPAWRREWARVALVGALLIWPIVLLRPLAYGNLFPLPLPDEPPDWHGVRARSLLWVYLAGVALGLVWFGLTCLAALWVKRRLVAPSPSARTVLRGLAFPRRWDRPRLMVDPAGRRPALLGCLRPTIVLPPELDDPGHVETLRWTLRHELAHAADHDPLFGRLGGLAHAIWFFVLPIAWIRRQMRLDQEYLADRAAATRHWHEPWQYAATLVAVAAGEQGSAAEPVSGSIPNHTLENENIGAGSPLLTRVRMILRCPFSLEPHPPAWSRWGLAGIMVAGTTLASTLQVRGVERLWDPGRSANAAEAHGRLVMVSLTIQRPGPGEPVKVTLPPPLPERFDLKLDVFSTSKELTDLELAGCRFGGPVGEFPHAADLAWHTIRLVRRERVAEAWIDNLPVSCQMTSNPGHRLNLRIGWDHETPIRNLTLVW